MYLNVSECLRLSSPLGIGHKAKKAGPHFDRIEAAPATCHGKSTSELSLAGPKYEAMSTFSAPHSNTSNPWFLQTGSQLCLVESFWKVPQICGFRISPL